MTLSEINPKKDLMDLRGQELWDEYLRGCAVLEEKMRMEAEEELTLGGYSGNTIDLSNQKVSDDRCSRGL